MWVGINLVNEAHNLSILLLLGGSQEKNIALHAMHK
jgi:hypothetical protein